MPIKYRPSSDAIYSTIDNEVVIMSMASDQYISLNDVASRIWELISEKPLTMEELVQTLLDEYEVEEAVCRMEVGAFLEELNDKGLVSRVGEGESE